MDHYSNDMLEKTALNETHYFAFRHAPDYFVEDFNFDGTVIAGRINQFAEFAQYDYTIAHHGAPHQDSGEPHGPTPRSL